MLCSRTAFVNLFLKENVDGRTKLESDSDSEV